MGLVLVDLIGVFKALAPALLLRPIPHKRDVTASKFMNHGCTRKSSRTFIVPFASPSNEHFRSPRHSDRRSYARVGDRS